MRAIALFSLFLPSSGFIWRTFIDSFKKASVEGTVVSQVSCYVQMCHGRSFELEVLNRIVQSRNLECTTFDLPSSHEIFIPTENVTVRYFDSIDEIRPVVGLAGSGQILSHHNSDRELTVNLYLDSSTTIWVPNNPMFPTVDFILTTKMNNSVNWPEAAGVPSNDGRTVAEEVYLISVTTSKSHTVTWKCLDTFENTSTSVNDCSKDMAVNSSSYNTSINRKRAGKLKGRSRLSRRQRKQQRAPIYGGLLPLMKALKRNGFQFHHSSCLHHVTSAGTTSSHESSISRISTVDRDTDSYDKHSRHSTGGAADQVSQSRKDRSSTCTRATEMLNFLWIVPDSLNETWYGHLKLQSYSKHQIATDTSSSSVSRSGRSATAYSGIELMTKSERKELSRIKLRQLLLKNIELRP